MTMKYFFRVLIFLGVMLSTVVNAGSPPKGELTVDPEKVGGIVLYGHSLFGPLRRADREWGLPITSRGWGGASTKDLMKAFDERVVPLDPKLLVLNVGAIELVRGSAGRFERDFKKFIKHIDKTLPDTTIVWQSVTPSPKAWNWLRKRQQNATIRAQKVLEQYPNAFFIDADPFLVNEDGELNHDYFREDGIHYNGKGAKAYKAYLKPYIFDYWEQVNQ